MNTIKVSVIIPVFNSATYLEKCIKSVLKQVLEEIEVIIINDGSTDESKKIISILARKDNRIVFIDGVNEGVSIARNKGIKRARGEYIAFVDADDWIAPSMFKTLYVKSTVTNSDLAICNVTLIAENMENSARLHHLDNQILEMRANKEIELVNMIRFKYDYANWNKIYSTAVIKKNELYFNEKMHVWEDLLFNLCYLQFAQRGVTIKECLYNYRIHPLSAMSVKMHDTVTEYNLLYSSFIDFCKKKGFADAISVFEMEMRRVFYYAIIPQLLSEIKKRKLSLLQKIKSFAKELKKTEKGIFGFSPSELKGVQGVKKRLLSNKQYLLFSFLVCLRQLKLSLWKPSK